MQSTANLNQRISPDITCLSSYSTSRSSTTVSNAPSPPSTNTSGANSHTISEVPAGLYEFVVGNNGEVKILCKICQYISNKKSNFKRHFTNMHFVHDEDSTKTLECCGIRFTTKGDKFHHTKSVHKSGYKCTICSKVFDRPALLQRHLAKHTGKKPYKCSLCSYQTPNKANAKRHIEKKHSDVQEGSILFVTDDGEQIEMEVVSKPTRDVEHTTFLEHTSFLEHIFRDGEHTSSSLQSTAAVVKSSADSTSFGSITDATFRGDNSLATPFASGINLPRCRSASISSSSLSPPNHLFAGALTSVFGATMLTKAKEDGQDKKRKINHSIEAIMQEDAESHSIHGETTTSASPPFTATRCIPETLNERNHAPFPSQENLDSVKYSNSYNHPNINELQMGSYCSPNWSRSSSLFPINNDYAARNFHQTGFLQQSTYTSASTNLRNQSSPSFVFRQCAHGCWHHVDNQAASDFSGFVRSPSSSFVPTHFFPHQSPDLRSSSSSISQQTENSYITSLKSDDDNDSDIIDVVGDDDDDGDDDSSRRLQMLSSICEGLGSFSTAEIPSPVVGKGQPGECKITHFDSPPVESVAPQRGSFSSTSGSDKEEVDSAQRYVPKKLRVARGHYKL